MKQLLILILLFSLANSTNAQLIIDQKPIISSYPQQKLNLGFSVSDLFVSRFCMESEYLISGPSAVVLALGTHMGYMDMDNRLGFNTENKVRNIYTNLGYKHYMPSEHPNRFPFMRINLVYENTDVEYFDSKWIPRLQDGLTYYHFGEVQKFYHVESLAFGLDVGYQFTREVFFTDLSFGLQYKQVISKDSAPDEFRDLSGYFFNDVDYSGFSPRIRAKVGLYLY